MGVGYGSIVMMHVVLPKHPTILQELRDKVLLLMLSRGFCDQSLLMRYHACREGVLAQDRRRVCALWGVRTTRLIRSMFQGLLN